MKQERKAAYTVQNVKKTVGSGRNKVQVELTEYDNYMTDRNSRDTIII